MKLYRIRVIRFFVLFLGILSFAVPGNAQQADSSQDSYTLTNIPGRKTISLNGKWQAIIDWYDQGLSAKIWTDQQQKSKSGFYEYAFTDAFTLAVPGDWNSQQDKLLYYEGSVWYKKAFQYKPKADKQVFIHFGAVSYTCDVYLNGLKLGSHEGGFTSFSFNVTGKLKAGNNTLIVKANNKRLTSGIPAMDFDWWNYGGITRDVNLVETPSQAIKDYFIQLKKGSLTQVEGWVKLSGVTSQQRIGISIPEAGITKSILTNAEGLASISFSSKLKLWSPENPHLYRVVFTTSTDTVSEKIGFRSIEVKGTEIVLNKKPIFLKGINFHEEIPQRVGRAYSEADSRMLLSWVKELGCNFLRLAHYPQNEYTVRLAEEMGIMLWEEIPVWQGIQFDNPEITGKMKTMLTEMIARDKNRCGIIIWSLSNETAPSVNRNKVLTDMARYSRSLDPTRLITSAFDHFNYDGNKLIISDTLSRELDVLAANKYFGWYAPWPAGPGNVKWQTNFEKPLIISEFGGEALFGKHSIEGITDGPDSWTEEYQAQLYNDNIQMFKGITNLRGTCPWVLADFRSPKRLHPVNQEGWNRKGLISDKGLKKQSWFIMKKFYEEK